MFGTRHKLAILRPTKLRERAIWRLIAPDTLRRREHWIAAITLFVIAIILIAMNNNLIANFPPLNFLPHRPDDT